MISVTQRNRFEHLHISFVSEHAYSNRSISARIALSDFANLHNRIVVFAFQIRGAFQALADIYG